MLSFIFNNFGFVMHFVVVLVCIIIFNNEKISGVARFFAAVVGFLYTAVLTGGFVLALFTVKENSFVPITVKHEPVKSNVVNTVPNNQHIDD